MHRKLFKGLFFYFISALFIPFPILMLPVAKQVAFLGLDNQVRPDPAVRRVRPVVQHFIFVAYINSIPMELEEAAIMAAASTWTVFRKIIFPLLGTR